MRIRELFEAASMDSDKIDTIIDIARKHQGYVTASQLQGIAADRTEKDQTKLFNMLNKKYRINVVDDFSDVKGTDSKIKKLDPKSRKVFDYFTSPERNNINNDVVRDLMADALANKKISASNWMTLTNNIKSGDGMPTRGAEWNVGRKLGNLGVDIDQSLTINQKKTAIEPSDKPVSAPSDLTGPEAKAYEKIVNKTNYRKRNMISNILKNAFDEKRRKVAAGDPGRHGVFVTLPADTTNKLVVNTAMRQADIGRLLGPLGIELTL